MVLDKRFSAKDPGLAERVAAAVNESGFAIVTDLLDPETCQALVAEVDRVEREHEIGFGTSEFEGFHTKRIFNPIARGPTFRALVIDDTMLDVIEALLGDGFLLSGTTSMHLSPGETSQLLHADDGMISLPRPHVATMVTSLPEAYASFAVAGIPLATRAQTLSGVEFACLDAIDSMGHFIEVYERSETLVGFYDFIREAAKDWDGADPVRTLSA